MGLRVRHRQKKNFVFTNFSAFFAGNSAFFLAWDSFTFAATSLLSRRNMFELLSRAQRTQQLEFVSVSLFLAPRTKITEHPFTTAVPVTFGDWIQLHWKSAEFPGRWGRDAPRHDVERLERQWIRKQQGKIRRKEQTDLECGSFLRWGIYCCRIELCTFRNSAFFQDISLLFPP